MNKTKIDWCDSTWNPVTGCYHECPYCYARSIANRLGGWKFTPGKIRLNIAESKTYIHPMKSYYGEAKETDFGIIAEINYPFILENKKAPYPFGFQPTFHKYRLGEYKNKRGINIFVCSMADLFGEWVPDEWIEEVFKACKDAPQHNYLFLTKNLKRYESLLDRYMPPNMWFGWTQTGPMGNECDFTTHHSIKTFISIEPLLKPFKEFHIRGVDWVIIGAETGKRKGKVVPKKEWIEDVVNECKKNNIPVFMKSSLLDIWGEPLIQEFPEELIRKN